MFCFLFQLKYPKVFTHLQKSLNRLKMIIDWLNNEGHTTLPDVNVILTLINNNSVLYTLKTTADITKVNSENLRYLLIQFYSKGNFISIHVYKLNILLETHEECVNKSYYVLRFLIFQNIYCFY